jgi:hypothetical protein
MASFSDKLLLMQDILVVLQVFAAATQALAPTSRSHMM